MGYRSTDDRFCSRKHISAGVLPASQWRRRPRKRVLIPAAERARVLFERELHQALRDAGFDPDNLRRADVKAARPASVAGDRET